MDSYDLFTSARTRYPGLSRHIPQFEIFLVDLTAAERDQVQRWADALVARKALAQAVMLWLFRFARRPSGDPDDPAQLLMQLAPLLERLVRSRRGKRQFQDLLVYYVLVVRGMTTGRAHGILQNAAPRAASTMSSLLDMLVEKERAQAARKGRAKGLAEGKRKGRVEGERGLLLRQLTRKFGPLTPDQQTAVETASGAELELYSDRVLTADSIEAVLVG
jgi:hypothetical protein